MARPGLDLELLRAFVAVAEQRSFTRAARELHRTQSAVSMQVKRLEAMLGVALLDRGGQGAEMTAAGRRLFAFANRMLALSEQAIEAVAAEETPPIRLGVMEDFGLRVASPAIAAFSAAHAGASVELRTGLTAPMVARLGAEFDIVVALHPEGEARGTFLGSEQATWAVGPKFDASPGGRFELALYAPGCLLRQWAIEALDQARQRWALTFVGHDVASVHAATFGGSALTVVKTSMSPAGLRPPPAALHLPRLPVAEVRLHRARSLSPLARSLADHLVHAARSAPAVGAGLRSVSS